jgi:hypothetical protein
LNYCPTSSSSNDLANALNKQFNQSGLQEDREEAPPGFTDEMAGILYAPELIAANHLATE